MNTPARAIAVAVACLTATSVLTATQSRPAPRTPAPGATAVKPAAAEKKVAFAVGEHLSYDVSWSNYVSAGTLDLRVESKKPSYASTAYYVTAVAQATGMVASLYPLYYKADSLIDAFSLLPQRGSLYSREGGRERNKVTTFDHARRKAQFQMKTASLMNVDLSLPPLTQDILSSIYVLRSIQPRPGDRLEIPVSDSAKLYQVTFAVGNAESVAKSDGTRVPALRVTPNVKLVGGESPASGTVLWLANDATFRPVRMETTLAVGRIVIALK